MARAGVEAVIKDVSGMYLTWDDKSRGLFIAPILQVLVRSFNNKENVKRFELRD